MQLYHFIYMKGIISQTGLQASALGSLENKSGKWKD